MKRNVKELNQEEFEKILNYMFELAYREGVHWARVRQEITLKEGMTEAKENVYNIIFNDYT